MTSNNVSSHAVATTGSRLSMEARILFRKLWVKLPGGPEEGESLGEQGAPSLGVEVADCTSWEVGDDGGRHSPK